MSAFLYRLGRNCARHPFRVIGIWLLAAVAIVALQGAAGGRAGHRNEHQDGQHAQGNRETLRHIVLREPRDAPCVSRPVGLAAAVTYLVMVTSSWAGASTSSSIVNLSVARVS